MELTLNALHEIKLRYGGLTAYLGEKIKRDYDSQLSCCFKIVNEIEKAVVLIEKHVVNFCTKIVITDSTNIYPHNYEIVQVDKMAGVTAYIRRMLGRENLYRLNPNDKLFDVILSREVSKPIKSITETFGKYGNKRLLIMGSGPSSAEIDCNRIAKDIDVMVINYNFNICADWHFYMDKKVATDLNAVLFKDHRKIIGPQNRPCAIQDYSFNENDYVKTGHSGATALQFTQKMGYREIYLAGYDYMQTNNKDHLYNDKNDGIYKDSKKMKSFLSDFQKFSIGGNVYNLNSRSSLKAIKFTNKENIYAN